MCSVCTMHNTIRLCIMENDMQNYSKRIAEDYPKIGSTETRKKKHTLNGCALGWNYTYLNKNVVFFSLPKLSITLNNCSCYCFEPGASNHPLCITYNTDGTYNRVPATRK